MIKTSAPVFDPKTDVVAKVIEQSVLTSSHIVVVCGAGISVAAGIPTFRGEGSISKANRELFNLESLQQKPSEWCSFMAKLASKALNAAPTTFHNWLGELHNHGKLLRVYTQNIDGLEMKAGVTTYPNLQAESSFIPIQPECCISMHGSLHRLRCTSCNSAFLTEAYMDLLAQGVFPQCISCVRGAEIRQLEGKRRHAVSTVRPDIVLYGEDFNPAEEKITSMANIDSKALDLLLVVGTSLRIPGTKDIVRSFSSRLRERTGGHGNRVRSIFVNVDNVSGGGQMEKYFDAWVEGDCQQFASILRKQKEEMLPGIGASREVVKEYASARQDPRALWRYY